MRLDMFLVMGLIVNSMFAVLYPVQIFGDDPLGLNGIKDENLQSYMTVNGSIVGTYNPTTGQIEQNSNLFTNLEGAVTSTEGDSGILTGDLFSFVDWVKVGFNLIKTLFMFVIGFIALLWSLAYPFNFLIGMPFSLLYIFSIVSFMLGRA